MATKTLEITGIGTVNLKKHKSAKSMRISLSPNGDIDVTLPRWVPYSMAVQFVNTRKQWIIENKTEQTLFTDKQVIGKSHNLTLQPKDTADPNKITGRIKGSEIIIRYPQHLSTTDTLVQAKARAISIKALRQQAEDILPDRLRDIAALHDFTVNSIAIRNLKARWGSCNSKKDITLNLYLMLLPWDLIDYVIVHELSHTKAMDHGIKFWEVFEAAMPDAKKRRNEMKQYKPAF